MSPSLPPPLSTLKPAFIPFFISPNSSLRWMRSAWNVIFAGCICWPELSLPLTLATSLANALVVDGSSPLDRARHTASAMRLGAAPPKPAVSSPNSSMMRTSSSCATVLRNSLAGTPLEVSKRRSSGPSASGRNPRVASLNCGEDMPTSSSTPDTVPGLTPAAFSASLIELKGAWCMVNRLSSAASASPTATASGSMSNAWSRPSGAMAASIALVCPPRPNVPSTNTPPGSGATSARTVSSQSAGRWAPWKATGVDGTPAASALLLAAWTYIMRWP
mmetsp:Transcript_2089/g.7257  ORF Transcript_2089/g.7257 Transcript_2089/m.7257 type:complete len:276 (+) Transcript_2089:541-1368(+)